MKILIFGKRKFNDFMQYNYITDDNVEEQDMLIVSINNYYDPAMGTDKAGVRSYFKRNHSNVLIMHFGDYSEEFVLRVMHEGPTGIFNDYKAKVLYDFIKKNKDKKMAVIHCGAGISRSGAVGAFIQDTYGTQTWEEFKRKNSQIEPNGWVLKLLREQLRKDNG